VGTEEWGEREKWSMRGRELMGHKRIKHSDIPETRRGGRITNIILISIVIFSNVYAVSLIFPRRSY